VLPEIRARLLASMDAGRLVLLCGAGLSMAPPSTLPSARRVAETCFDTYRLRVDPNIDPALRQNLEALAEHFVGLNTLKSQFIGNLVPWAAFERPPNPGHAAVADFLLTRTATAALTSNYDKLIERRAWDYGADFQASLDGDEATASAHKQAPFLKFHGCAHRDRGSTVWAPSQLHDPVIADRIEKSRIWMAANLRQKDLLVVGFWSDWSYLNQIFAGALAGLNPLSVTVVDLSTPEELQAKAPALWTIAHQGNVTFTHVQASASDVLDTLRRTFSENYIRQLLAAGQATLEAATGAPCDPQWLAVTGLDSEALYDWRTDAEGVPKGLPATNRRPNNAEALGYFHLLLRKGGATPHSQGYALNGRQIRVINGAASALSTIAARFVEAPSVVASDVYVAVGSIDVGLPGHVFRPGTPGNVMRPGAHGSWHTFESARAELAI
jgi:hypothetical protein